MLLITEYIYFSFYERFVYLSDDKLIAYLDKYQTDFDDFIVAKETNCGKYFEKKEESYYDDKTKQTQIKYYYYDGFVSESPESKSFLKKHKDMIVGINDMTWRNGFRRKKIAEVKQTGKPSNASYTYEDALLDCRTRTHLSFVMKNISYVKLLGLSLKGPYHTRKSIEYINDNDVDFVKDWSFFQHNPELYNGYFDDSLSDTDNERASKLLQGTMIRRASQESSDEFMINCTIRGLTHAGFTQIKPKWFISLSEGIGHHTCGSDWISLPFVPFFEGIHFNP